MTKKQEAEELKLKQEAEEKAALQAEEDIEFAKMEAEEAAEEKKVLTPKQTSELITDTIADTEVPVDAKAKKEADKAALDKAEKEFEKAQEAFANRVKFPVLNCNLKRNGLYYAKGSNCPESKLEEFRKLGFVEEV